MSTNDNTLLQDMIDVLSYKETYKLKFVFNTSDYTCSFQSSIQTNPKRKYTLAFKRFSVYNTIFNITEENNRFTYSIDSGKTWLDIFIPPGSFELLPPHMNMAVYKGINRRIQNLMKEKGHNDMITLEPDEETSQAILKINNPTYQVDFSTKNSIGSLLGFKPKIYKKPISTSEDIIKITLTNDIDIHCSLITSNSYVNGVRKPILYSISAYSVVVGAKIIVSEINPIKLPINTSTIDTIRFQILDDNGKLIDFNGETIILDCILEQV